MLEPRDIDRYERELRAMVRRAADEDPDGFAVIRQLLDQAVQALPVAAEISRRRYAYSWDDLADAMGTTRQAVHKRYTRVGYYLRHAMGGATLPLRDVHDDHLGTLLRDTIKSDR